MVSPFAGEGEAEEGEAKRSSIIRREGKCLNCVSLNTSGACGNAIWLDFLLRLGTVNDRQLVKAKLGENVPQLQRVINRRKLRQLRAECTEINKQNCVASSLFLSYSISLPLSFSELEARNLILKITRQGSCSLNKFSSHVLVCFCGVAVMAAHTRESKGCAHVFRITKEKLLEVHTHECILAGHLSYSLARALQSYPAGRSIVLYLTGSGRRKTKDRKATPGEVFIKAIQLFDLQPIHEKIPYCDDLN